MTIAAFFLDAAGAPLTSASPLLTYEIFKVGTGSIASGSMVELDGGWFVVTGEEATAGSDYTWTADGDPSAAGQTPPSGRYAAGAYSGSECASPTQVQEIWTALGLNSAAPCTYDYASGYIRALANTTPIDIAISTLATAVALTRQ